MMSKRLLMRALPLGMLFVVFALSYPAMALDEPHETASFVGPLEGCDACHSFHGASYPSLLGTTKTCAVKCHNAVGPGTEVQDHSSRTTDTGHGDWEVDCWACHDPHTQEQNLYWSSTYGKYIRRDLNARVKEIDPAQDLQAGPEEYYYDIDPDNLGTVARDVTSSIVEFKGNTEFVDNDGSSADDICRVCHANTGNFSTSLNTHTAGATANPGDNCNNCHDHTAGWAATGGTCTGCHGTTQPSGSDYRRQVAGTGGDFERLAHHVTDGTTTEVVDDADCELCHDQTQHQTWGDDPVADAGYKVFLNDPDGGTSWTYDGTGSSVEGFCTGCHDSDGANGDTTPFTDGRTAPDIASNWSASSHGNSSITELADDKCLACHGGADSTTTETVTDKDAHGSASVKLLSALIAGEVPANTEEGLCFACHDGAPAPQNIEAAYNGTTNYQDTAGDGALINQRHDVSDADQTYSGGTVECTNCHNPHMATSTNKNIDPDTPTSAFTGTYNKANSYTRDGYNFSFQSATSNLDPMNPIGCTSQPATIGAAVEGIHNGDDLGTSGGTYTGIEDQTYNVLVSTGGTPGSGGGNAKITVTSTGTDSSGPTNVTAFNTPIVVGTKGVTISFGDGGSGGTPGVVGSPSCTATCQADHTAATQGSYTGSLNGTYTLAVQTTGTSGNAVLSCSSTGHACSSATYTWNDNAWINLGNGVQFKVDDTNGQAKLNNSGETWQFSVTAGGGDGVLTLNDTWNIATTMATAGCSTAPEPDMVTFCLVCHDGTEPTGVTMDANMVNIASAYRDADQHGSIDGNNGGNGYMKAPWQDVVANGDGTWANAELSNPYAAVQCNSCHDGHGSDNLYHLKTSVTIRGQEMAVGGGPGSGQEASPFTAASDHSPGDTTYLLPCFDGTTQVSCSNPAGVQLDHKWGAWCSFCHDLQSHGQSEDNTCRSGHKHGGGAF